MIGIPEFNWLVKGQSKGHFSKFLLDTPEEIKSVLHPILSALCISEYAENILHLSLDDGQFQKKDSYKIKIAEKRIEISGAGMRGLYYGAASLKLLLLANKNVLEYGTIYEEPDFESRALMLDVSRGKMPTLQYLKDLVSVMADLRYNILQLYCEDKLYLSKHPRVGSLTGYYTEAQIKELDSWCRERFIELQPCLQTYSHMSGLLRTPGYEHLSENESLFSLAAGNEAVYDFLEDEFSEVLPWFSSKTVNINMDEAYDLGTGFSKSAVEHQGKGAVFLSHIRRVIQIAEKCGAEEIIMYGDVVNKYPELAEQLPDNVIISDWNYNPQETYPSLDLFRSMKRKFWAAGGVSTWNTIFPRMYNMYINIIGYSHEAKEKGACGFMVTDWGDYGHYQPLGLSLYGYMLGASQAFHADKTNPEEFERRSWPLILQDERLQKAFRLLMDSNLVPDVQTGFKTMTIYYFFDDMLDGLAMRGNENYPRICSPAFESLKEKGQEAFRLMKMLTEECVWKGFSYPDQHWSALFGEKFIYELYLSAWMTRFIGEKGTLAYRIIDAFRAEEISPEAIMEWIWDIRSLYNEFMEIRDMFEKVWGLRAYRRGIESTLSLMDRAGVQMSKTVCWLSEQREKLLCGKKEDTGLNTYHAAEDYKVLWTGDFKNMWDRAYPWQ